MKNTHLLSTLLLCIVILTGIWSVICVEDTYLTWILESFPVWIGLAILIATYRKHRLANWLYAVIALHCIVLLVGAHYSYAEVPLGYWMEDWFGFTRNNYDKIGHFMQGVTPSLLTIYLLTQNKIVVKTSWVNFLSFSVAMMVSAIYEIIEWLASLSNPTDTEAFLGTQGYVWDTQTDMFLCLLGSIVALSIASSVRPCSTKKE